MSSTLSPGANLGRYKIHSRLGVGGMGEVYLAEDKKLERRVALKILPAEVAAQRDRMERFVREAKSAAALSHPNIAQIFEISEHEGTHFITMELIEGVTLREKIHEERTELKKLLRALQHVAEGLAKAHAAGIVHRDLKPDNIMITHDGYAKILDFGLAKLVEPQQSSVTSGEGANSVATAILQQHSKPGMILGTAGYMSPEQAQGKTKEIDHRSDIFSFGCILYEAITRHRAFAGADTIDTLNKIIREPVAPLSNYNLTAPADLQRIVRRCLAKDPDERYQSIKDVAIELKEVRRDMAAGADLDVTEPPPSKSEAGEMADASIHQSATTSAPTESLSTHASSAEYVVNEIKRHKTAALLALLLIAGSSIAYAVYRYAIQGRGLVRFQIVKLTRLTAEGDVESVTISPDGKYIAYSLDESGRRSLWTKHLATGSRVPIVPASEALALNASTFSNDGSYVYFTRVDEQNPRGALYQVPVLGGTSKKILTNVSQPISLSPDGKQIAFGRFHMTRTEDELLLANADGTDERHLITVDEPAWLSGSGPAWSPDGTMLAIGYGSDDMVPAVISIADGKLKPLTSRRWDYVGRMAWFSDGRGLVFTAREQVLGALQVWQQSYPQAEIRRVTNDLSSYGFYSLALTADSNALVSVQGDPGSNIWIAPEGDAGRARAATASKNVEEGHYNLAWTPDGRVVFDSNENVKASIWIVGADGSNPKMLTDGSADDFAPEVSPDGRFIIFNSGRMVNPQAFRMSIDGGEVQQLTRGVGGVATHSISPDGKWLLYSPFTGGIRKLSLDGGTDAEIVARGNLRYPQLSPDGKLLAYFFDDEQTNRPRIAVIEFGSGAAVRTFDLPVTSQSSLYESTFYRGFHWSADGRAIVYLNTLGGVSNLWSQPLAAGAPKQITDFKSDLIYNFAYSRDGHQLALARGSHTRDAVLISEVK
jgi:serine/threonine protein kinase